MNMPACRSPIGCICRRNGPRMSSAARRRVFPRRSNSRPSRRLRSTSCALLVRPAYRAVSCWTIRATVPTPSCAPVSELGLRYVVGIIPTIKVQAVLRRGKLGKRISAKSLALTLPKHAWRTITWREGTNNVLRSRFARVQVRTAPNRRAGERPEETLLIEWPEGEDAPTKYWLSTVDKNISFRALVDLAKMRWRVERDYQELKQEVGLGHYEGR